MKGVFLAICLVLATVAVDAKACGSHSCESGFSFSVRTYNFGGGYGGYGGYYGGYGYRPFFFGNGATAFRRSFRLQNRAFRAAQNGNFFRAARLSSRANRAFARGVQRGGGFAVMPFWF